jgi:23S rRNA (uridine2552-2'-O)-methyltransferase
MADKSRRWLQRHVNDPFVKSAQREGYRSRAAYKLKQILQKYKLVHPGMVVLDLGAAPGGWSQVLCEQLRGNGRIIALDRLAMPKLDGVEFLQGDFTEQKTIEKLQKLLDKSKLDWIFSDMAPNMSGIAARDQAECQFLAEQVMAVGATALNTGAGVLIKVFQGSDFSALMAQFKAEFSVVRTVKPKASRDTSREVYLLATGYTV